MKRITPTVVEIDLEALRYNYRQLRGKLPSHVRALCVVKSNAYGHGAQRVAKTLQDEGVDFFGVGTIDEAMDLREASVKRPILALLGICDGIGSGINEDHFETLTRYQITPVLYDLETAEKLDRHLIRQKKKFPVHIKIDTGMTRLGVLPKKFEAFCERLKSFTMLEPQGLLTHLADAADPTFTKKQMRTFQEMIVLFEEKLPLQVERYYHISNSQGIFDRITDPSSDRSGGQWLSRMGIALYGAYPLDRDRKIVDLKPVMSWKSKIIQLKEVPAKTSVSYNRTFVTKKPSRIGVIPVGYADGYPRALSNQSRVLVRGRSVPVAGIVCMDLMMIDVTSVPEARAGDEVVLIGRQGKEEIRADELAKLGKTISYEIFCRVSPRVPRVYRA